VQYLVLGGGGQRPHIGEALQEALVVGDNGGDLGLLQHDLRHPHPVGGDVALPGQVPAAVAVEPGQHRGGDVERQPLRPGAYRCERDCSPAAAKPSSSHSGASAVARPVPATVSAVSWNCPACCCSSWSS